MCAYVCVPSKNQDFRINDQRENEREDNNSQRGDSNKQIKTTNNKAYRKIYFEKIDL